MSKDVLKLFLVSIFLLVSCAPVRVEMPSYQGRTFREVLSGMQNISGIKARFSITFRRDGREQKGDAALDLSEDGDMSLRVYSLGFLAMELSSRNGYVKSSPSMTPDNYFILTEGFRDCFFWWDRIRGTFIDRDGYYILSDIWRTVWVDRKTFLPVRQKIRFGDGREIDIRYDRPRREDGRWFQSRVLIEYNGYSAVLSIDHMSFQTKKSRPVSHKAES